MKIIPFLLSTTLIAGSLYMPGIHSTVREVPKDTSQKMKPATIRVLLAKTQAPLILEAKGCYRVYNPVNEVLLASGVMTKRDFVSLREDGIHWGEKFPNIFRLRIVPGDAASSILVDGIEYRGSIDLYVSQDVLHIINEVDIERYLKSTLTCQVNMELDNEVIEAMAIVARTNAYYWTSLAPHAFWHVEAQDVRYQGFALSLQNLQVEQAVNNTRNVTMTYHGTPFATTWTKDSAGKTASFGTIFRKNVEAPHGVITPIAAKDRLQHRWSFEISKARLAQCAGLQKFTDLDLYEDKESKKVYGMRLKHGNQTRTLDVLTLQKALGESLLKSNDFSMEVKGDKVYFSGYGEGLGVGLCLHSAAYFAEKGEKAQQILAHFFPDTELQINNLSPKNRDADLARPSLFRSMSTN